MAVDTGGGSPAYGGGGGAGDAGVKAEAVSVHQSGDDDASICTYTEELSMGCGSPASDTSLPEILCPGAGVDWEEGHAGRDKVFSRGLSAWTFREGFAHYDFPMDGGRASKHMNGSGGLPALSDTSSMPGSEDLTEDLSQEGTPIDMSPWPPGRTVFLSALNGNARRVASGHREKGVHRTEPMPIVASGAMSSVYVEQHHEISAPESCAAEIQPQNGEGQQGAGSDPATAGDNTWMQMSSPRMHSESPQEKLEQDSEGASEAEGPRHSRTISLRSVQAAHRNDDAKGKVRLSHHRHPSLDMNDVRMWSDWRIHTFQPEWKSSFQPEWRIDSMPFSWKRCFSRRQEQTQSGHVQAQTTTTDMPTPFKSQMQKSFLQKSFKDSEKYKRIKNTGADTFGSNCMKWERKPFESGFTESKSGKFCLAQD